MKKYDVIIIGGGTAGISAARAAAQQGASVGLIQAREAGGRSLREEQWALQIATEHLKDSGEILSWGDLLKKVEERFQKNLIQTRTALQKL